MKRQQAFTLIEILVVIAIIAILMTIAIVALGDLQKKGRDAKRLSDLKVIQSALEQYHADNNFYPLNIAENPNLMELIGNLNQSKTYLNHVPSGYQYVVLPSACDNDLAGTPPKLCTSYCLYAQTENIPLQLNGCAPNVPYNYAVVPN